MDTHSFNAWWHDRMSHFEWSATEGELFRGPGSGPVVVPENACIEIHAGHGLHHGSQGQAAIGYSGAAAFAFALRDSSVKIEGPATAADVLHELTSHVHREIARNTVLCSLLHVVSDLASGDIHTKEDLEEAVLDHNRHLEGLDAYGLLPAPVTREQLKSLTKHVHLGPGLPTPHGAAELDMIPDPLLSMSARQLDRAVDMALGGGATFFEGLVALSPAETQAKHPVYLAKWSRPFA